MPGCTPYAGEPQQCLGVRQSPPAHRSPILTPSHLSLFRTHAHNEKYRMKDTMTTTTTTT